MVKKKEVAKKKSTAVAETNWEEEMAAEAKQVAKIERPTLSTISLRAGIMSLAGNEIPDNTLDCIITGFVNEHVYYTSKWDPDNVVPPDCFALGLPGDDLYPHEVVGDARIAETCDACPLQRWEGSTPPSCKTRRRFSIIPLCETPEEVAESEVAQMSISITSISSPQNKKNWTKYVNHISSAHQRPCWGVVTRITTKPHPKHQFHVHFDFVEKIEDSEMLAAIAARRASDVEGLLTPYDMTIPEENQEEGDDKSKKY